ncbi:MAG: hypothetical protein CMJ83_22100 [Planctomycetes bacterium]|nr:hypothetical protein [Planctomycetota bacterium]
MLKPLVIAVVVGAVAGGLWCMPGPAPQVQRSTGIGYDRIGAARCGAPTKTTVDLARDAVLIVRAHVLTERAVRASGLIWSEWELDVTETWKGDLPDPPLLVREPGGKIGHVEMRVSAGVRYRVGDEVVAFIVKDALGQWRTAGMTQGQWRVADGRAMRATDRGRSTSVAALRRAVQITNEEGR